MAEQGNFEILSKAYQNPTKVSVIMLLAEGKKLTVTQMSEYIDVSRSNLYHFVSQMVDDGILKQPEVVPKKNYVEKYYSLNEEMFKSVDVSRWTEHIRSVDLEEFRNLISSALLSYSLRMKLFAEIVAKSGSDELERIRKWMVNFPMLSYSTMGLKSLKKVHEKLEAVMNTLLEEGELNEGEPMGGGGSLMMLLLPFLMNEEM